MRVEEPYVQIYVSSEIELHELISLYFAPSFLTRIHEVFGPESDHAKSILDSNAIIRRKPMGYTHKVILRDGAYNPLVKDGLRNYLSNLSPDVVQVPKGVSQCLIKDNIYIWNAYFYTNDPSVIMFIDVIYPGLVLNCYELVVLETK
jgi:hypothetical protein